MTDYLIPESLKKFIEEQMGSFKCATHDVAHCFRVANLSKQIAIQTEGANPRIAYIAGALHDVLDSKLLSSHDALHAESVLRNVLKENENFVTQIEIDHILDIVKSVGYKNIIRSDWKPMEMSVEYRCVQDADLLDAIGAVGVARCFAYGGKKNRTMFGVTKPVTARAISQEEYLVARDAAAESGVDHFFDKLLRIHEKMLTAAGRALAAKRQAFMVRFMRELDSEMEESSDPSAGQIGSALSIIS